MSVKRGRDVGGLLEAMRGMEEAGFHLVRILRDEDGVLGLVYSLKESEEGVIDFEVSSHRTTN